MKTIFKKILFISLLFSASIPSNVQTSWFTDTKNILATLSKLVKTDAKYVWDNKWRSGTFATGAVTGAVLAITAGVAIHEWGHKTTFNHFFPNSAKITRIRPWGGATQLKTQKINFNKKIDRLKIVTGLIAGPTIGFLASYSLFRLLKHYNTKNPTHSSLLYGLEFGLSLSCLTNIGNVISTNPSFDGPRACSLIINVLPKQSSPQKWYSYLADLLIGCCLGPYYLKALSPSYFKALFPSFPKLQTNSNKVKK